MGDEVRCKCTVLKFQNLKRAKNLYNLVFTVQTPAAPYLGPHRYA
jgi:hypothetical protein